MSATVIITLLAGYSVPLSLASGEVLAVPPVLAAGTWIALVIGTAFLAIYARRVAHETFAMSQALAATQMALAREQQLSALGGVVAAAAHELGTPLATIKLTATELVDELAGQPALQEDAALVRDQADRCAEILRAMGPQGNQDALVRFAPFSSVVEEAAAPHAHRGIEVVTRVEGPMRSQPSMARSPEIVQGLRNLVQNAVDFAATTVWIDLDWDAVGAPDPDRRRRPRLPARADRPHRRSLRAQAPAAARAPGLHRHGARPLHRQDPARAQRRPHRLRQCRRRPGAAPAAPERGDRHRRLAARPRHPARPAPATGIAGRIVGRRVSRSEFIRCAEQDFITMVQPQRSPTARGDQIAMRPLETEAISMA